MTITSKDNEQIKHIKKLKEKYGNNFITRAGKMNIDKIINIKE